MEQPPLPGPRLHLGWRRGSGGPADVNSHGRAASAQRLSLPARHERGESRREGLHHADRSSIHDPQLRNFLPKRWSEGRPGPQQLRLSSHRSVHEHIPPPGPLRARDRSRSGAPGGFGKQAINLPTTDGETSSPRPSTCGGGEGVGGPTDVNSHGRAASAHRLSLPARNERGENRTSKRAAGVAACGSLVDSNQSGRNRTRCVYCTNTR